MSKTDPTTRYVVRPCDEPDGSRTWDVVAVTRAQRARARRQGEYLPGTVVHQALRTRAQARAIARRLVEVAS